jgi:hypothetical protein
MVVGLSLRSIFDLDLMHNNTFGFTTRGGELPFKVPQTLKTKITARRRAAINSDI